MNFDTPLVEYLIIGMHTASWMAIIILRIFKVPTNILLKIDTTAVLLLIPFVYIIGMMADDLVFSVLKRGTEKIKKDVSVGKKSSSKEPEDKSNSKDKKRDKNSMDENIALKSPELYNAYEARVRRVKIIAAAIFNWPLLGLSLCIYFSNKSMSLIVTIAVISTILTATSYKIWQNLTRRAYSFREKASFVISEEK